MRTLLVTIALLTGCAADDDDGGGSGSGSISCPDEAEVCIVHDDGWEVTCEAGIVQVDDLTRNSYCAAGSTEVLCETGGRGNLTVLLNCAGACADDLKYFDTFTEYSAFAPASMCL